MPRLLRFLNVPRPPEAGGGPGLVAVAGPVVVGVSGVAAGDTAESDRRALFEADPDTHPLSHALYAYPTVHHPVWRTLQAQARVIAFSEVIHPLPPASFDEHLALDGIQESEVWVGDRLRFPDCELVVTGPRLPDARFNETLGFPHAARLVAQSRWCGFWLAVRRPGTLAAGQAYEVVAGPRDTGLVELFRELTEG